MGKLVEGLWDCKYCGTKRIKGRFRECPNCGKARGTETTFYLLDVGKKDYVPEKEAKKFNKNPDWVCNFCGNLNSDNSQDCVYCGAPRTAENLDYFENKKKEEQKQTQSQAQTQEPRTQQQQDEYQEKEYHQKEYKSQSKKAKFTFTPSILKSVLLVFLVAISIFGIVSLLSPKEYEIVVNELSWKRTIEIERYQTVQESSWSLPAGANLLYTNNEYSHSEQVLDHYETRTRQVAKERISGYETYVSGYRDLGNGYFEEITGQRPIYETYYETETYQEPVYRSEPVYRTKYYYEIDKWLHERTVATSGTDKSPYWGDTNLSSDERISSKSENYMVEGIDTKKDKTISFSLPFEDWSALEISQNLKVKITFGQGEILE